MKIIQNADLQATISVLCDMSDHNHVGEWTVIMRRTDGSKMFDGVWIEYENGIGQKCSCSAKESLSHFWAGNSAIFDFIQINGPSDLLLNVTLCNGEKVSRLYHNFTIVDSSSRFWVTFVPHASYKDGLSSINGSKFAQFCA